MTRMRIAERSLAAMNQDWGQAMNQQRVTSSCSLVCLNGNSMESVRLSHKGLEQTIGGGSTDA